MDSQKSEGSVTTQLPRLRGGDESTERWFVDRYFERICSLARQHLGNAPRAAHDEEDVALTVMRNFLEGAKQGTFQRLRNREDLHQILMMLTRRKSVDFFRRAMRRRRHEVGESIFNNAEISFDAIPNSDPPRDLVAEIADEIRELFQDIECAELQLEQIAIWRLKGFSVSEIADRLSLLPHTIYRRLQLIRDRWNDQMTDES